MGRAPGSTTSRPCGEPWPGTIVVAPKVRSRANPNLHILGVVITMHDKRTALARDIRAQIDKVFGSKVFKTVITKSVRLEESPAYKESIFSFAPESSGAAEYYRLCEEVMDRA